eukprot:15449629-Alexandrium_andersonii.AAC.1
MDSGMCGFKQSVAKLGQRPRFRRDGVANPAGPSGEPLSTTAWSEQRLGDPSFCVLGHRRHRSERGASGAHCRELASAMFSWFLASEPECGVMR